MPRWALWSLVLMNSQVVAQSSGYYDLLCYRSNDPFVFCTQGQNIPDKCWMPVAPYTGNYALTGACNPPNQYGRSWTAADHDALNQYLSVCPKAMTSGSWEGHGQPERQRQIAATFGDPGRRLWI